MPVMNFVTSDVKVICENKESYAKIVKLYQKHLEDYSTCLQIKGNLFVDMKSQIETDSMPDRAMDYLSGIAQYATEIDPDADVSGSVIWLDSKGNSGKVELEKENGRYVVSDPDCQYQEKCVIKNAATEVLIHELEKRGFAVSRKKDDPAEPEEKHTERWRVMICRNGKSSSRYFKDGEYNKALRYGASKKEDAYSICVYEYDPETGEYLLGFIL